MRCTDSQSECESAYVGVCDVAMTSESSPAVGMPVGGIDKHMLPPPHALIQMQGKPASLLYKQPCALGRVASSLCKLGCVNVCVSCASCDFTVTVMHVGLCVSYATAASSKPVTSSHRS